MAQKLECRRLATFEFDREDASGKGALLAENADLLGVLEQCWIDYVAEALVAMKSLSQALRVFALPVHAQRNRRQPVIEHPALIRLKDVAEHRAPAAEPLDDLYVIGQRHACHHVAEAGEILGCGIEHEVRPELERMLKCRPEKGVVHH